MFINNKSNISKWQFFPLVSYYSFSKLIFNTSFIVETQMNSTYTDLKIHINIKLLQCLKKHQLKYLKNWPITPSDDPSCALIRVVSDFFMKFKSYILVVQFCCQNFHSVFTGPSIFVASSSSLQYYTDFCMICVVCL